jgi:hypothetical protein
MAVAVFGLSVYMSYSYASDRTRASIPGQSITETYADLLIIDDTADDPVLSNRVLEGYLGDR